MATALHLALLLPVLGALGTSWIVHWQGWTYFRKDGPAPDASETPAVTAIMPLRGTDARTEAHLKALLQQDVSVPLEVVVAVEHRSDPAAKLVASLQARYDRLRLVVSSEMDAPGVGKLRNLIAGVEAAAHDHLVFVDGDAALRADAIQRVVAPLADPEVGLVFAAPVSGESPTVPSAFESVTVNDSAMLYAAQAQQGERRGAVGTLMATRRNVLDAIGGLASLADRVVGIDVAISRAINEAGFNSVLLHRPVRVRSSPDTWAAVTRRLHRWLVTIRRHTSAFPAVVVGLSLPLTWTLAFLGVALVRGVLVGVGLVALGVVWAWKLGSQTLINRRLAKDQALWPRLWIVLVGELWWLAVFIWSLTTDRVYWAGRTLAVGPDGTGSVVGPESPEVEAE